MRRPLGGGRFDELGGALFWGKKVSTESGVAIGAGF
jgi:hypothetical protein